MFIQKTNKQTWERGTVYSRFHFCFFLLWTQLTCFFVSSYTNSCQFSSELIQKPLGDERTRLESMSMEQETNTRNCRRIDAAAASSLRATLYSRRNNNNSPLTSRLDDDDAAAAEQEKGSLRDQEEEGWGWQKSSSFERDEKTGLNDAAWQSTFLSFPFF